MQSTNSTVSQIAQSNPEKPVAIIRPQNVRKAAIWFIENFPGTVFYAVKSNPSNWLIQELISSGIEHFDVASIEEINSLSNVRADKLAFMHPIKSELAISQAFELGVRTFCVDSFDEIKKLNRVIGRNSKELTLLVRIRADNTNSVYPLASKFGCNITDLNSLLEEIRILGTRTGVSFHVGSQCIQPIAYGQTINLIRRTVDNPIEIIDVGGGFPIRYPHSRPPHLKQFMYEIEKSIKGFGGEVWCEPGRALSGESTSLLVRVDARKGNTLYINDGAYGCLFDAAHFKWQYPCRLVRESNATVSEFSFYGPTCDSIDYMAGPFMLPKDVCVGDYIEIGMLGAYGVSMTTRFNGFGETIQESVEEDSWVSIFS